jgi:hypothetical protein
VGSGGRQLRAVPKKRTRLGDEGDTGPCRGPRTTSGLKGEGARMEPPLWEAERLKRGLDPAL